MWVSRSDNDQDQLARASNNDTENFRSTEGLAASVGYRFTSIQHGDRLYQLSGRKSMWLHRRHPQLGYEI